MIGCCVSHEIDPALIDYFDFICEFQPRFFFNLARGSQAARLGSRLKLAAPALFERLGGLRDALKSRAAATTFSYADYVRQLDDGSIEQRLRTMAGNRPLMRSTFFGWDNSPRYRERNTTVSHEGLQRADLAPVARIRSDGTLPLILNSWNEWSEGAALEAPLIEPPLRQPFLDSVVEPQPAAASNTP